MSLSEMPTKTDTSRTAKDIANELMGGTLCFCERTGYKQNVMMLTFFWLGFLLSAKSEWEEHELLDDVMGCYVNTLGVLFPQLLDKKELQEQTLEIRNHYWSNLKKDFATLSSAEDVGRFLRIANKINEQGDEAASYLLKGDAPKTFLQIAAGIRSSIYNTINCINNDMAIEYRGYLERVNAYRFQSPKTENVPVRPMAVATTTPSTTVTKSTTNTYRRANEKRPTIYKVIAIVLAVLVLYVLFVELIGEPAGKENAVPEPATGEILMGVEEYGSSITVTASSGRACLVKVKTPAGVTQVCFYVRAGETATVCVPAEVLCVYFATGQIWQGTTDFFGEETRFSKDKDAQLFEWRRGWEYKLTQVTGGNFSQTPIDKSEF